MTQYFRGNLAGLTVRSGKLADKKVIDCLYTCKEGLDLQVPEDSGRGVEVTSALPRIALPTSSSTGVQAAGKGLMCLLTTPLTPHVAGGGVFPGTSPHLSRHLHLHVSCKSLHF